MWSSTDALTRMPADARVRPAASTALPQATLQYLERHALMTPDAHVQYGAVLHHGSSDRRLTSPMPLDPSRHLYRAMSLTAAELDAVLRGGMKPSQTQGYDSVYLGEDPSKVIEYGFAPRSQFERKGADRLLVAVFQVDRQMTPRLDSSVMYYRAAEVRPQAIEKVFVYDASRGPLERRFVEVFSRG